MRGPPIPAPKDAILTSVVEGLCVAASTRVRLRLVCRKKARAIVAGKVQAYKCLETMRALLEAAVMDRGVGREEEGEKAVEGISESDKRGALMRLVRGSVKSGCRF